jgi:hypothetical protein
MILGPLLPALKTYEAMLNVTDVVKWDILKFLNAYLITYIQIPFHTNVKQQQMIK